MKSIVTLGNCQGQHLAYLLGACLPADGYQITGFSNNVRTGNLKKADEIIATIQRCDVFIYQPLAEKHGPLCTSRLVQHLKPGAQSVSFPYFYNDGAYSLCHAPQTGDKAYGTIFGEESIVGLLGTGLSSAKILARYRAGLIDFRLPQRFAESLAQMKLREQECQIKLTDFIEEFARRRKLFLTHNHPTNAIFFEMLRQLVQLTALPVVVPEEGDESLNELARTNCPVSPYDIEVMGYQFGPDPDWYERGCGLIRKIVAEWRSRPHFASVSAAAASPEADAG